VPPRHRDLGDTKSLFDEAGNGRTARKGAESASRPTLKECSPRLPIVYMKEIWVKLKENIIIISNTMNRGKIFFMLERHAKYCLIEDHDMGYE
jgi:hypothetical protein